MTAADRPRPSTRGGKAPPPALFSLLLLLPAGCTQESATLFGKALFGLMIVSFIVIPFMFWRAWSKGKAAPPHSPARTKEES
ncbi:MAG: hypothetical protein ACF8XB_25780 [Planctomycetota bacterium JB042]